MPGQNGGSRWQRRAVRGIPCRTTPTVRRSSGRPGGSRRWCGAPTRRAPCPPAPTGRWPISSGTWGRCSAGSACCWAGACRSLRAAVTWNSGSRTIHGSTPTGWRPACPRWRPYCGTRIPTRRCGRGGKTSTRGSGPAGCSARRWSTGWTPNSPSAGSRSSTPYWRRTVRTSSSSTCPTRGSSPPV